ncbi:GNAT family N-acetyltransferase [Clostridium sp.]|uniref:GNAT family N-acetyltransferase n=1 Tax=Clostridium sp. TaxID=1506 RepID=UPI003F33B6B5
MVLSTERLILSKITKEDRDGLYKFLGDIEVLYAWGHTYSYDEVLDWINTNNKRFEEYDMGYYLVKTKDTNEAIGVCGTLVEEVDGKREVELAYIFNKNYWGKGYAVEASKACVKYCFDNFDVDEIVAQIKFDNNSSMKVVERCGFKRDGEFIKHYRGEDILHYIYKFKA